VKPQNLEMKNEAIRQKFITLKKNHPDALKKRLKFSWSNWSFGAEALEQSVKRLGKFNIQYIELHGNRYGNDLGYDGKEVQKILKDYGITAAGICGMFSRDNDLSANRPALQQSAVSYIKRNLELGAELGVKYFLVVPGAVGRPEKYDGMEFQRSVETLQIVAYEFVKTSIRGAVEPIRSAEVSFCHTVADAKRYIEAVHSEGIRHINGDIYHMQEEEDHIGEAIISAGKMLTNLHIADTNRRALGKGSLDLDTIIMALYSIDYNNDDACFVTPEPLGPGGDVYRARYGTPESSELDTLVESSVQYFREREEEVLSQKE